MILGHSFKVGIGIRNAFQTNSSITFLPHHISRLCVGLVRDMKTSVFIQRNSLSYGGGGNYSSSSSGGSRRRRRRRRSGGGGVGVSNNSYSNIDRVRLSIRHFTTSSNDVDTTDIQKVIDDMHQHVIRMPDMMGSTDGEHILCYISSLSPLHSQRV